MFARARSAAFALLVLAVPAASALAVGQGRLTALVVDAEGKPVAGATVAITNDEIAYSNEVKTDRRGGFALMVLDATRVYTFTISKEGYPTVSEDFKLNPGEPAKHTFVLAAEAAAAAGAAAPPVTGRGRAARTYNEGVEALQADDRAGAIAKFEEAASLDAAMPEPQRALTGLYFDAERYDEAIAAAEALLALAPEDPVGLQTLYDAYQATGRAAEAKAALDRLMASASGTEAAVRIFNAGADAAKAGDLDRALALFQRAVEADPQLAPGHAAVAQVHLAKSDAQQAVEAAERALAIDPANTDAQRARYQAYLALGQQDKAQEAFQQLAAADPKGLAKTLYEQGSAAFNANRMAEAVESLEQAVAADPDHARAHYMLGLAYANSGDTAKARQHLQRFVELAPDDSEAATAREMIQYMG